MLKQNALVALPFFTQESYQTFRHPAADGLRDSLAILCRADRLLPIIIKRTPAATFTKVYLCSADSKVALDITTLISGTLTATVDGVGWVYNPGAVNIGTGDVPKHTGTGSNPTTWGASIGDQTVAEFVGSGGYFYLDISISTSRYFSELLYVTTIPEFPELSDSCASFPFVRLEATTQCDIGDYFPADLVVSNKVFIKNGGVYAPQYEVERVVSADGNGQEDALWVKLKKIYSVNLFCPESVADWAASLVLYRGDPTPPLNVTDEHGFQYAATIENVSVQWPDQFNGIVAEVELQFSIDAVTQTGCC